MGDLESSEPPKISHRQTYRYNIKLLYNIQIQKYIANKKIIQNYAQMKYKWPVTAIKPLKNKRF